MQEETQTEPDGLQPMEEGPAIRGTLLPLQRFLRPSKSWFMRGLLKLVDLLSRYVVLFLVAGIGVGTVWTLHWKGFDHEAQLAALGAYLLVCMWGAADHASARERKRECTILGAAIMQASSHDLSNDSQLYQLLGNEFKLPNNTDTIKLLKPLAAHADVKDLDIIGQHYKGSPDTARDYLCVIFAHHESQFLREDRFLQHIRYFASFHRDLHPRNRLTRVFSVPAQFGEVSPIWTDQTAFTRVMRAQLFALLWLNDAVGADTKLHIYNPAQQNDRLFFRTADYVICHNPASDRTHDERSVVFVLIPNAEHSCIKLRGAPLLYEAFHREFYTRLSVMESSRDPSDDISEVCWRRYHNVRRLLDLDVEDCRRAMLRLFIHARTLCDGNVPGWSESFYRDLANRWKWWCAPLPQAACPCAPKKLAKKA